MGGVGGYRFVAMTGNNGSVRDTVPGKRDPFAPAFTSDIVCGRDASLPIRERALNNLFDRATSVSACNSP